MLLPIAYDDAHGSLRCFWRRYLRRSQISCVLRSGKGASLLGKTLLHGSGNLFYRDTIELVAEL